MRGMWSVIRGGTGRIDFLVGVIPTEGESSTVWACRENLQVPHLVGYPNLTIRKTLRRVLGLFTVMILKRVSESIFRQRSKFTALKVKDGKEVANYLMAFNQLKIIHLLQVKKHLRT